MKKISEISKISKVSIRTLRYYDEIGLLKPAKITQRGYRMYDDTSLSKLGEIMLLKELGFPLKQVTEILSDNNYDRQTAIDNQIELLKMRRKHIDEMIEFAEKVKKNEVTIMDYKVFDNEKYEAYQKEAKEKWGKTDAYKEFERKTKGYSKDTFARTGEGLMNIFSEFGEICTEYPESEKAQTLVQKLQDYISDNYYTCTKEILSSLGMMYVRGGEMTENIDNAGGQGTAEFVNKAIQIYCK